MGDSYRGYGTTIRFGGPLTRVTKVLIIANVSVFVVQVALYIGWRAGSNVFRETFALTPSVAIGRLELWQFITYSFLHEIQDVLHVAFNMLGLWLFAGDVELSLGRVRFLVLYFASVLAGGLCMIPMYDKTVWGASAAVFGVMAMYARLFPDRFVWFFIPIRVRTLVFVYVGVEVAAALMGGGGIAHLAHLGGFAFGWFFLPVLDAVERWRERRNPSWAELCEFALREVLDNQEANEQHMNELRVAQKDAEVRRKVDALLEKVGREGLQSLTARERKFLGQASKRYRNRS